MTCSQYIRCIFSYLNNMADVGSVQISELKSENFKSLIVHITVTDGASFKTETYLNIGLVGSISDFLILLPKLKIQHFI